MPPKLTGNQRNYPLLGVYTGNKGDFSRNSSDGISCETSRSRPTPDLESCTKTRFDFSVNSDLLFEPKTHSLVFLNNYDCVGLGFYNNINNQISKI